MNPSSLSKLFLDFILLTSPLFPKSGDWGFERRNIAWNLVVNASAALGMIHSSLFEFWRICLWKLRGKTLAMQIHLPSLLTMTTPACWSSLFLLRIMASVLTCWTSYWFGMLFIWRNVLVIKFGHCYVPSLFPALTQSVGRYCGIFCHKRQKFAITGVKGLLPNGQRANRKVELPSGKPRKWPDVSKS